MVGFARTAAVVCCGMVLLTSCGSGALEQFTLPNKAGTIQLPRDWRFRNASRPSDHATWFWYDPKDPFAKLRIVASSCAGCASENADGRTPAPRGLVPSYATVTGAPSPYVIAYSASDAPYPDDGMVIVTHKGSRITGSLTLDLWLPEKKGSEAAKILATVRTSG